jgi:hypothetical protein
MIFKHSVSQTKVIFLEEENIIRIDK